MNAPLVIPSLRNATEIVAVDPERQREQWLALRMSDITASDVAAVCGLDPYKTPLRIYAEKTGLLAPQVENEAMTRGRHFEKAAISWLVEKQPTWDVRKATVYLRNPELRIGATPDVVAVDPEREAFGTVQIKVIAARVFNEHWRGGADADEPATIRAPIGYQLQTITEAKMLGASWAALAALVVTEFTADLHIVPVDIHDGAWTRIKNDVAFFWACVAEGRPPPVDPSRDAETIAGMYPAERIAEPMDLSGWNELPALLDERADIMARNKVDDLRKKEIETEIKARLGEHERGLCADGRVIKWRVEPRGGYTVEPSNPRVLRIAQKKESRS
jgi:putative phage-type endonuclease